MNLYRLKQDTNNDYDTFDSAIVAAENEEDARNIAVGSVGKYGSWVKPEDVEVELIGVAKKGIEAGVILASFNAG